MRYIDGVVTALSAGRATVAVTVEQGGCGRCHEVGGCQSQNLSRALCQKNRLIEVVNTLNLSVGDPVRLGMEDEMVGDMATLVYVIPLSGILLGAGLGHWSGGEWMSVLGAGMGFIVAIAYSRLKQSGRTLMAPRMVIRE